MLAIIGGSGLYSPGPEFELEEQFPRDTHYGETSADILLGSWRGQRIAFLPRHGQGHSIAPHRVNYRANLRALEDAGVTRIVAVNAVGGITGDLPPLTLATPDQIIDYTSGRAHSYSDGDGDSVLHVDFTHPYSEALRQRIAAAAEKAGQPLVTTGTYGCTNGPRLESAAEIRRLARDGCNMVGMTGMPEAGLARELGLEYASLVLVVNWAAGVRDEVLRMEDIVDNLSHGIERVRAVLRELVEREVA